MLAKRDEKDSVSVSVWDADIRHGGERERRGIGDRLHERIHNDDGDSMEKGGHEFLAADFPLVIGIGANGDEDAGGGGILDLCEEVGSASDIIGIIPRPKFGNAVDAVFQCLGEENTVQLGVADEHFQFL